MTRGRSAVAALVMALVTSLQLGGAPGVGAAAEKSPVAGGSWYFEPQVAPLDTPAGPVALPATLPTPDVPRGDFAVTAILGLPNKETYLHVDPSVVAPGATVEKLTLTLKESGGGLNVLASSARLSVHPVVGFWSDGSEGAAWAGRPDFDPSVSAPGARAADGTWTFDLTAIAKKWAEGLTNNGVALVSRELVAPDTWQVVFSGTSPRPFTEGIVQLPPVEPAADPAAAGAGATDAAGDAATATAPIDVVVPSAAAPLSSTPATSSAPAAKQSGLSARLSGVRPAVAEGKVKRAPPWHFYLAVAGVVGLLLVGGLALGDKGEPLPDRRGSVLRTLERRSESES